MKFTLTIIAMFFVSAIVSCDVQSGITKNAVEKYGPTPTPSVMPTPVEEPIDPKEVVMVDSSLQGPTISISESNRKRSVVCDKFNRVMVNGRDNEITVTGGCRQILINGDRNEVTAVAAAEIVLNGSDNKVRYSRYANGKRPVISDNKTGNVVEKAAPPTNK